MIDKSIIDLLLQELIARFGTQHVYNVIRFKHPDLYSAIMEYNKNDKFPFCERAYRYIHDITEYPQCVECSGLVKRFRGFNKGYGAFCSRKCASKNSAVSLKRRNTLTKKYGVKSVVDIRWSLDKD
jgi:hypothetical protein